MDIRTAGPDQPHRIYAEARGDSYLVLTPEREEDFIELIPLPEQEEDFQY